MFIPVPDGPKPLLMPLPREPPVGVVTIGELVVEVDGSPVEGVLVVGLVVVVPPPPPLCKSTSQILSQCSLNIS